MSQRATDDAAADQTQTGRTLPITTNTLSAADQLVSGLQLSSTLAAVASFIGC